MSDFKYEIKEKFGNLSEKNGYTKELNLISYNGRDPVYDIRTWHTDENDDKKMSKGITLTKEEVIALRDIINDLDL